MEETKEKQKRFKILSIDGGGIRGITPAQVLCYLEEEIRKRENNCHTRLCDYFDLICGTSTGGIIAIGLALGISAEKILNLYTENATTIFHKTHTHLSFIRNKPLYKEVPLEEILKKTFSDGNINPEGVARMEDAKTRLCIPVYNLDKGAIEIFKTGFNDDSIYRRCPVVDVALSTAAAPVYYKPHTFSYESQNDRKGTKRQFNLVDGGVLANNPALIGITEAMYNLHVPLENISLLSIGTGTKTFKESKENDEIGSRYWITPNKDKGLAIYNVMASAQSLYINDTILTMKKAVKDFEYVRLQHIFDDSIPLDATDHNSLEHLKSFGENLYYEKESLILPFIEDKIK